MTIKYIKHYAFRAALMIIATVTIISAVILTEISILYSNAPAGPGQAKGIEGRYYNLVYTLTPCPSAPLEEYEDENIRFYYFNNKLIPGMGRPHSGYGEIRKTLAETMLNYIPIPSGNFGNTFIGKYKPTPNKLPTEAHLKSFIEKYALENVGEHARIEYGYIQAAPFSAYFSSGPREGICFTDLHRNLYCFEDQDLPMQQGNIPFLPWLRRSLGLRAYYYAEHDYGQGRLKEWFKWPCREKTSDCNFAEIKQTLRVKGKK